MSAFDQTVLRPDAPAFPMVHDGSLSKNDEPGLSARQHAAILLRVPNSGVTWLDDMIRQRLKDDMYIAAVQGMLSNPMLHGKAQNAATTAQKIAVILMQAAYPTNEGTK